MADRLSGKVVVVAGASAGMGLATGAGLAAEGADVVMLARRYERLMLAAEDVGPASFPIVCDVTDPDSVRSAFAGVADRFGRVDALFNVAGVARIRRIEDATDDDIAFVFGVNLLGPIYTTRAAIPLMRAAGAGDIVNVSSEIVDDYMPQMVLYGASKGGLDTFTKMMVHELKADTSAWCGSRRARSPPPSARTSRRARSSRSGPSGTRAAISCVSPVRAWTPLGWPTP